MLDKRLLIVLFVLFITATAHAVRIARPIQLTHPLDEKQINEVNNILEDVFNMQQGRYELDIVTTTKTNAKNGEMYFIQTGNTVRIHFKANNQIFTVSPDGF